MASLRAEDVRPLATKMAHVNVTTDLCIRTVSASFLEQQQSAGKTKSGESANFEVGKDDSDDEASLLAAPPAPKKPQAAPAGQYNLAESDDSD